MCSLDHSQILPSECAFKQILQIICIHLGILKFEKSSCRQHRIWHLDKKPTFLYLSLQVYKDLGVIS